MATRRARKKVSKRRAARPRGVTDALWSCVLNDYLSEDEEDELVKVVGLEDIPAYSCFPRAPKAPIMEEDPRTIGFRGGGIIKDFEKRDGTPGIWKSDPAPELPPVVWLELPQWDGHASVGKATKHLIDSKKSEDVGRHFPEESRHSQDTKRMEESTHRSSRSKKSRQLSSRKSSNSESIATDESSVSSRRRSKSESRVSKSKKSLSKASPREEREPRYESQRKMTPRPDKRRTWRKDSRRRRSSRDSVEENDPSRSRGRHHQKRRPSSRFVSHKD